MMIRNILIITVIAALVPTAMSNVSASADAEIALFSRASVDTAFQFGRDPIPMSFCESGEHGFVVVMEKCYDQDAITDFETEEDCYADDVCRSYRVGELLKNDIIPPPFSPSPSPEPSPPYTCDTSGRCTPIEPGTEPEPEPSPEPEPVYDCSR